jgi:hypothetical protein
MKEYSYRKLDSWGREFYRICFRIGDGPWMALGGIDWDREEDARRQVEDLTTKEKKDGQPTR